MNVWPIAQVEGISCYSRTVFECYTSRFQHRHGVRTALYWWSHVGYTLLTWRRAEAQRAWTLDSGNVTQQSRDNNSTLDVQNQLSCLKQCQKDTSE